MVAPPTPSKKKNAEPAGPLMEDWWLARDAQGRAGWVLARMVDLDVPLEIAQYAEGQRFIAFFVLNEVQDGDKKVSEYLALLTEPKDGQPFDFDKVHVFTWNVKRHRYETAYRERNMNGVLPVTVTHEDFGKEGNLPVFILREKDEAEISPSVNTNSIRRLCAGCWRRAKRRHASARRRSGDRGVRVILCDLAYPFATFAVKELFLLGLIVSLPLTSHRLIRL